MGRIVVEDGVHGFAGRDGFLHGVEEADELLMAMALHAPAHHLAVAHVEGGNPLPYPGAKRREARGTGLVTKEPVHAVAGEVLLPAPDGGLARAGRAHERVRAQPIRRRQHDGGAPDVLLRAVAVRDHGFKPGASSAVTVMMITGRITQTRTLAKRNPDRDSFVAFNPVGLLGASIAVFVTLDRKDTSALPSLKVASRALAGSFVRSERGSSRFPRWGWRSFGTALRNQ